jgi:hypothetical protein
LEEVGKIQRKKQRAVRVQGKRRERRTQMMKHLSTWHGCCRSLSQVSLTLLDLIVRANPGKGGMVRKLRGRQMKLLPPRKASQLKRTVQLRKEDVAPLSSVMLDPRGLL